MAVQIAPVFRMHEAVVGQYLASPLRERPGKGAVRYARSAFQPQRKLARCPVNAATRWPAKGTKTTA